MQLAGHSGEGRPFDEVELCIRCHAGAINAVAHRARAAGRFKNREDLRPRKCRPLNPGSD